MKEDLITFETAKLAKEKGFDWECNNWWVETLEHKLDIPRSGVEHFPSHEPRILGHKPSGNYHIIHASAPTQSSLQKWLWETHKIWVEIYLVIDGKFSFYIKNEEGKIIKIQNEKSKDCKNPYIIFEEGLQEALKLI